MNRSALIFSGLLLLLIYVSVRGWAQQPKENIQSIAIILKITGQHGRVNDIGVDSHRVYAGRAKNLNADIPPRASSVIRIEVSDISKNILFSGYFENPLRESLESFEEDGIVNNNIINNDSGHINVRFPFSGDLGEMVIRCYSIVGGEEKLSATANLKLQ